MVIDPSGEHGRLVGRDREGNLEHSYVMSLLALVKFH